MKIEIGLSDGRKTEGFAPEVLHTADKSKEICLFFDTAEMYSGFLVDIEDNGIHLTKPDAVVGIQLPLNRLMLWFYKI